MTRISRHRIPAPPRYLPKETDHDDGHPRQAPDTGRLRYYNLCNCLLHNCTE